LPVVSGVKKFQISAQGVFQTPKRIFQYLDGGMLYACAQRTVQTPQFRAMGAISGLANIPRMCLVGEF